MITKHGGKRWRASFPNGRPRILYVRCTAKLHGEVEKEAKRRATAQGVAVCGADVAREALTLACSRMPRCLRCLRPVEGLRSDACTIADEQHPHLSSPGTRWTAACHGENESIITLGGNEPKTFFEPALVTLVRSMVGDGAMRRGNAGARGPVGSAIDALHLALDGNDIDAAKDAGDSFHRTLSGRLGELRDALREYDGLPPEPRPA